MTFHARADTVALTDDRGKPVEAPTSYFCIEDRSRPTPGNRIPIFFGIYDGPVLIASCGDPAVADRIVRALNASEAK